MTMLKSLLKALICLECERIIIIYANTLHFYVFVKFSVVASITLGRIRERSLDLSEPFLKTAFYEHE